MSQKSQAIILLHEIYGVNQFIKDQCQKYMQLGFDVLCPNLLGRESFSYDEEGQAYDYFKNKVGFDRYRQINDLAGSIEGKYDKIWLLGYSVGATIAWRCCENPLYSGIIACYGSRIRDYTALRPVSPALLLFAEEDSFDVPAVVSELGERDDLKLETFGAQHGFLDPYSDHYHPQQKNRAESIIADFLK